MSICGLCLQNESKFWTKGREILHQEKVNFANKYAENWLEFAYFI